MTDNITPKYKQVTSSIISRFNKIHLYLDSKVKQLPEKVSAIKTPSYCESHLQNEAVLGKKIWINSTAELAEVQSLLDHTPLCKVVFATNLDDATPDNTIWTKVDNVEYVELGSIVKLISVEGIISDFDESGTMCLVRFLEGTIAGESCWLDEDDLDIKPTIGCSMKVMSRCCYGELLDHRDKIDRRSMCYTPRTSQCPFMIKLEDGSIDWYSCTDAKPKFEVGCRVTVKSNGMMVPITVPDEKPIQIRFCTGERKGELDWVRRSNFTPAPAQPSATKWQRDLIISDSKAESVCETIVSQPFDTAKLDDDWQAVQKLLAKTKHSMASLATPSEEPDAESAFIAQFEKMITQFDDLKNTLQSYREEVESVSGSIAGSVAPSRAVSEGCLSRQHSFQSLDAFQFEPEPESFDAPVMHRQSSQSSLAPSDVYGVQTIQEDDEGSESSSSSRSSSSGSSSSRKSCSGSSGSSQSSSGSSTSSRSSNHSSSSSDSDKRRKEKASAHCRQFSDETQSSANSRLSLIQEEESSEISNSSRTSFSQEDTDEAIDGATAMEDSPREAESWAQWAARRKNERPEGSTQLLDENMSPVDKDIMNLKMILTRMQSQKTL